MVEPVVMYKCSSATVTVNHGCIPIGVHGEAKSAISVLQFYIETTTIKPAGSPLFRSEATPHLRKDSSFLVTLLSKVN